MLHQDFGAELHARVKIGDIVVAGIPGGEATIKTFEPGAERVRLIPANPTMEPMEFAPDMLALPQKSSKAGGAIGIKSRYVVAAAMDSGRRISFGPRRTL